MKTRLMTIACGAVLLAGAGIASAQQPTADERVAALKSSLATSKQVLRQFEWIETTTVSLKGEQKAQMQDRCYYAGL